MKLIQITTFIKKEDFDRFKKASYEGKKKLKPIGSKTFSEMLREAIEQYEIK